jgi:hypothetical protein
LEAVKPLSLGAPSNLATRLERGRMTIKRRKECSVKKRSLAVPRSCNGRFGGDLESLDEIEKKAAVISIVEIQELCSRG